MAAGETRIPFGYGPLLFASAVFGLAISYNDGAYAEPGIFAVVVGVLLLAFRYGVALFHREPEGAHEKTTLLGVVWIGLAALLWVGYNDAGLVMYAQRPWAIGRAAQLAMVALLGSYLPWMVTGRRESRATRAVRFALLAACVVAAGIDVLKVSPTPAIDVWTIQTKGAEAFSHGLNPYRVAWVPNTAPGVMGDKVPYVYPPMQMMLSWVGWKLLGDVRYTMMAAIVGGGAAMRYVTRRGGPGLPALVEDAPALFVWFTPKLFFVLEQSWTDPVPMGLIAVAAAAHVARRRWLVPVVFGVAFACKQTMVFLVPMAALMLGFDRGQWIVLAVSGLASVVPYAAWDFAALKFGNIDFERMLPPRGDGLTLKNWAQRALGWDLPAELGLLFAAVTCVVSLVRLRGKLSWFVLSAATLYALFFAFNKWAFANYYFVVAYLAALAAAASFHPVNGYGGLPLPPAAEP